MRIGHPSMINWNCRLNIGPRKMMGRDFNMGAGESWELVSKEGPIDGYATLTYRMKVPRGYLYNAVVMYLRGWSSPKFSNSMAFVPGAK